MNITSYICILSLALLTACGSSKPKEDKNVKTDATETIIYETEDQGELEEVVTRPIYRATETVLTDLVHTQLEVSFDWGKSQLNGTATITAHPHFYPSDELILDAKSMDIHAVKMGDKELGFVYEDDILTINLGQTFQKHENYKVVIDYTAKPEEREAGGSAAITSDKGLYFINPTGADPNVMPQIWTQGETEASSVWFPTIDAPNSKTTQEMFITVEDKYKTLSNGKFLGSQKNEDGTRTDHWKQNLPHAPYLFMMAVGEFKVVEDSYTKPSGTKMPVNYYVEPEWEQYARDIFGETPAMIEYFSKLLDLPFPWDKYHQIVVRDYVSGAMENTGAVIFGDYAYKTTRELLDENDQSTIAHELFHHWFGDLVTCESWSNLTLNESFANYSQYLWDEHRYGIDEADYQAMVEEDGYFQSAQMQGYHDLVWLDYDTREQMFDGHSYNKGGRILHMLRNYLGDEAFFTGISTYLKQNQFKAAEYHHLRLAMEEVCGEDLNWFFDQWYLGSGHPILKIDQNIDQAGQKVSVAIKQRQDLTEFPLFRIPMKVAVWDSNGKTTHDIELDQVEQTFDFEFTGSLKLVLVDEQEMLLAKVSEKKPLNQYIFQYYNAPKFKSRMKALEKGFEAGNAQSEQLVLDALNDPFWKLRIYAIDRVSDMGADKKLKAEKLIANLAVNDGKSQVRAAAIAYLSENQEGEELETLLNKSISEDPSYLVVGTALKGFTKLNPEKALVAAKEWENEPSSKMLGAVAQVYGQYGTAEQAAFFKTALAGNVLGGFDQLAAMNSYTLFNTRMEPEVVEQAIPVYERLSENGAYYTKMFLGRNLDYLLNKLGEQKEEAEFDLAEYEKNNDAALADQLRRKIKKLDEVMAALEAVASKE